MHYKKQKKSRFLLLSLVLLISIALPLGKVSANMIVPFSLGSAYGNVIPNPSNVLEVNEENIKFEVSNNIITSNVTYKIVNHGEDANFTFIFPVLDPFAYNNGKYSFEVKVSGKVVPFESKELYKLSDIFKDDYANVENLVSSTDRVYFDPIINEAYEPKSKEYFVKYAKFQFFVFKIFLK